MRLSGSATSLLVAGSTPCMPARNTRSPARAPRLHVPSVLMDPEGLSVLTPLGDGDRAKAKLAGNARAAERLNRHPSRFSICAPPVVAYKRNPGLRFRKPRDRAEPAYESSRCVQGLFRRM